jgi:hypothetical protein
MNEAVKQLMNYVVIPVIIGICAICYRGVSRITQRHSNPISMMEKAIDSFGDSNPDFELEDTQSKAMQIINGNIYINEHIDTNEPEESSSYLITEPDNVSIEFDYSDGKNKSLKERFEDLKDIAFLSEIIREEMDTYDLMKELEPSNIDAKERFHKLQAFYSKDEFILSMPDSSDSDGSGYADSFLSGDESYKTESIESFFKGKDIDGNTECS